MEKLYVHEYCPDGEVSTVGLFYSRKEAEHVVAQLLTLPQKQECRYEITDKILRGSLNRGKLDYAWNIAPHRKTRHRISAGTFRVNQRL
jgi:hypothetical protein